jgi:hypothetical protein
MNGNKIKALTLIACLLLSGCAVHIGNVKDDNKRAWSFSGTLGTAVAHKTRSHGSADVQGVKLDTGADGLQSQEPEAAKALPTVLAP